MERILRAVLLASALAAAPAAAEVTVVHPSGFVVRHEVVVEADTKATWLALISPETWWRKEHTWSGNAANLSLTPSAGGCFCERIPEVDEPGRFTLEGSVEHMRVIQSQPETALRMRGGLGPLQSEPVTGILTIAISKADKGTRLVWEYNVAGYMRYEIPVISKAVDGVIGLQAAGLADLLGRVDAPAAAKDEGTAEPAESPAVKTAAPPKDKVAAPPAKLPAAPSKPPAAAPKPPAAAAKPKPKLDEAFGDLIGD
jgi:hypothetical protein